MNEQAVHPKDDNSMALGSMVVGIISIVTSCCCCGGIILGSLAVVLACLSRVETYFDKRAKTGLICGVIGMVLSVAAGVVILVYLASAGASGLAGSGFYY